MIVFSIHCCLLTFVFRLQIHAALCDAKFKGVKPAKFTAEEFSSVYETHISILTRLEDARPRLYHRLTEQLYKKAVYVYTTQATDYY